MPANGGEYTKPTEDEYDERVRLTAKLLTQGLYKGQIKKALRDKYGVSARTAEDYLSRARELHLAELNVARDEHKASSLALYRSILADKNATIGNKIAAQKRIDFILGLHAPAKVAFTDVDGRTLTRGQVEAEIVDLAEGLLGSGAAGEASPDSEVDPGGHS